ncbi:hypothetical protein FisN_37Hh010 [Fistulifera solaris]|uniref:Uncharacterized protein n=1 Tax=Fistulifera solaris TaxID=1519565 RepID=A0A1Z5KJG2_FISSO|nr:hypothetical protein FisN_37Hh010 [Fistulifera solaris]|eukprot:GAX26440.1 hypothetical protein FisN_37Hh010 [Fistulifera solaris]
MSEKQTTCPCKHVRWRLSSATAAEFGDLHRLREMKRHRKEALQLAAQQGHTAVTAFLLQQTTDWNDWITPLHRASFAGAVSTMRLLLDTAVEQNRLKALMRAPDITFGDQRNALHKAAAGGRFLAVHCLLEYYGQNTAFLLAKDGQGHTARDIAVAMRLRQIEEAKSVARWNTVAGGTPDWDKCVQLLRRAELQSTANTTSSRSSFRKHHWEPLPPLSGCVDCSNDTCLTQTWEDSFRSILTLQVEESLRTSFQNNVFVMPVKETEDEQPAPLAEPDRASGTMSSSFQNHTTTIGQECSKCHNRTIVVYRRNGLFVCKKCR